MYVCNRVYTYTYTYKYCVYHYRNCWHDSHKTYSKYLAYAWRLWTWPAPNCCRLQKLGHTVERNLIQLAQTFNAKSQTLLGRLNPDPLICSQSTYPTFSMFYPASKHLEHCSAHVALQSSPSDPPKSFTRVSLIPSRHLFKANVKHPVTEIL